MAVDPDIISAFKVARSSYKQNSADWHVINETIIMWELLGMNFIDLVKLRVKDVLSERIDYKRSKTNQAISVKNRNLVKEIVEFYSKNKESEDFVFRYGYEDSEIGYERYKQHRKRFNRRAKLIAHNLGFEDVDFTTYVIRHTFATSLYQNGISKGHIGEMYGHKDGRSIDTYIDKTDASVLDNAADKVLGKY
jgi:integrase/recombinase XerD